MIKRIQNKKVSPKVSVLILLLLCLSVSNLLYSQDSGSPEINQITVAPVKLDGNVLFNLRGVSSYPAETRASEVSKRIKKAAAHFYMHATA